MIRVSILLLSLSCISGMVGCNGGSNSDVAIKAADKQPDFVTEKSKAFFRDWLIHHGESAVVTDKSGIGIDGNATRLLAFHYGTNTSNNGSTVETEFRITLPDGREIVEFLAGSGKTQDEAIEMTFLNFTMSTFHVIYSCFINTDDPHMSHEPITIGGKEWALTTGGMFALGGSDLPDFAKVSEACRAELADLKLSDETHWLKFVYGRHKAEAISPAVTLDNQSHDSLTSRLDRLPWPATDNFYLAKQFIVLRPAAMVPAKGAAVE